MGSSQPLYATEEGRETSRVATFTIVMMFWAAVFVPVYLSMGAVKCALVLVSGCVIAPCILVSLRIGISTRVCGNMLCAAAFYVYTVLAVFCGGWSAPTTIWYLSMPVLALAVSGPRGAFGWTGASLAAVITFSALDYAGVVLPPELNAAQLKLVHTLGLVALLVCFYVLAYVLMSFERHARDTLREANRWLQLESSSDALTNVANRRCFDRVIEQEWSRHRREQLPLTVVLIDLDFFKEFNDLHGHLAGDSVLRLVATAIQAGVRRHDVVARFGGEEFVVILPNTTDAGVPEVTARIRGEVDRLDIQHPRSAVSRKVTISLGTTTVVPRDDLTHFDLLRQADEALYLAKSSGRDRAVHGSALDAAKRAAVDSVIATSESDDDATIVSIMSAPAVSTVEYAAFDEFCAS